MPAGRGLLIRYPWISLGYAREQLDRKRPTSQPSKTASMSVVSFKTLISPPLLEGKERRHLSGLAHIEPGLLLDAEFEAILLAGSSLLII